MESERERPRHPSPTDQEPECASGGARTRAKKATAATTAAPPTQDDAAADPLTPALVEGRATCARGGAPASPRCFGPVTAAMYRAAAVVPNDATGGAGAVGAGGVGCRARGAPGRACAGKPRRSCTMRTPPTQSRPPRPHPVRQACILYRGVRDLGRDRRGR